MKRLPFFISIPHGGEQTPLELVGRVQIDRASILEDGDAFTRDLYGIADHVQGFLEAEVARAFVDLNRAENDRPPANTDGVIKSHTCYGKPVYLEGQQPDENLTEVLLEKYHRPYHQAIQKTLAGNKDIVLALDCHTMAAMGPDVAPDPGQKRPTFCLGNRNGSTCPKEMLKGLTDSLAKAFELPKSSITHNQPFAGGYITRTHGAQAVPWIQVEMSRDLFLRPPYFDALNWTLDRDRILEVRARFLATLEYFFENFISTSVSDGNASS